MSFLPTTCRVGMEAGKGKYDEKSGDLAAGKKPPTEITTESDTSGRLKYNEMKGGYLEKKDWEMGLTFELGY